MAWKQIKDADLTVGYEGGWCLKYVQDSFHTDHPYPTAMAAWNANYGGGNHVGEPPLGITVPVYFSLQGIPAGHVATRLDDGWVVSSTQPGVHPKPYYHKNLQDLINTYARVYGSMPLLGWSEFVGTQRVVQWIPEKVTATAAQVKQAYLDILKRPADDGGVKTYTTNGMSNDEMRNDLMNSNERRLLIAAEEARAVAERAEQVRLAEVKAEADHKLKADAEAKLKAEAEAKLKKELEADRKAQEKAVEVAPVIAVQNKALPKEEFEALQKAGEFEMNEEWKPVIADRVRLAVYVLSGVGTPLATVTFQVLALTGVIDAGLAVQAIAIFAGFFGTVAGVFGVSHFTRTK